MGQAHMGKAHMDKAHRGLAGVPVQSTGAEMRPTCTGRAITGITTSETWAISPYRGATPQLIYKFICMLMYLNAFHMHLNTFHIHFDLLCTCLCVFMHFCIHYQFFEVTDLAAGAFICSSTICLKTISMSWPRNMPQARLYLQQLTVGKFISMSWPRNMPQARLYFQKHNLLRFISMSWPRNMPQARLYFQTHTYF